MAGRRLRTDLIGIAAFVAVYVLLSLLVQSSYYRLMMVMVLIWAVMGQSWNMLSGYSGQISFGQAAFFGLGGYTVTIAFVEYGISPWFGIPLGIVVGVLAGIVIGLPTFRLRGHYFALSMLAYPLAMLYLFEWMGYQEVPLPMMREAPAAYMQFDDMRIYIYLALVLLVASLLVALAMERTRFGMSLLAIKQNEPAAEASGIPALRWKMRAIMVSGGTAAAAGGLYAVVLLVVTPPTLFGVLVSAQALIMCLFGGVGVLWGPVIGAAILVPLAEILHGELGHIIPGIQGVVYGMAIILVILAAPDGIYWRVRDWRVSRKGPATPVPRAAETATAAAEERIAPAPARADARPRIAERSLLELDHVSRAFGGLRAVDDVTLTVRIGEIHGIIGPNGAGKTTLFNVINGFLTPDGGDIRLDGESLVGLKPHMVCHRGIGRTFQVMRPFPRMTVLENVVVGAFAGTRYDEAARQDAVRALDVVGLPRTTIHSLATGLTTRELRLMELARALAPKPRLLLLDETLAGLGHRELEDVLAVIRYINGEGTTVLIIEHTMQAMVRLADTFSVLDHGRLIASGPPGDVVREPKVIEAYLGRKWMDRARDTVA